MSCKHYFNKLPNTFEENPCSNMRKVGFKGKFPPP